LGRKKKRKKEKEKKRKNFLDWVFFVRLEVFQEGVSGV